MLTLFLALFRAMRLGSQFLAVGFSVPPHVIANVKVDHLEGDCSSNS
jgi:hypothetical protein